MKDEIIVKYIVGEAEEHEVLMVKQWLNEDPQHLLHYQQLNDIWEKSAALKNEIEIDADAAFDKVLLKIKQPKKTSFSLIYKVAASILIFISVASVFYFLQPKEKETLFTNIETQNKTILLSDSSKVILKPNAQLILNPAFGKNNRGLELKSGTAYFKVTKDSKNPFILQCENTQITVVGTEFEVEKNNNFISVFVFEGKVKFKHKSQEVLILKGEQYQFDKLSQTLKITSNKNEATLFYATGQFSFNQSHLKQVVEQFNEYYNCDIKFNKLNSHLQHLQLTTKFENNSLEEVLKILELTLNVKIEKTGKQQFEIKDKE